MHAVGALVATVAEAAGIVLLGRHGALEIGRGQVVGQHVVAGAEAVAPAPAQVGEAFLLVRQEQIVAAAKGVVLRGAGVDAEQVGQGSSGEPMTMQPPLAAGGGQAVDREHAQDFFPAGALAADGQAGGEKVVEVQRAPEVVGQPAGAPLPGWPEAGLIEPHLHRRGAVGRRRAIGGKERELARLAAGLVEDGEAALPRDALAVVDLAEVEHRPLRDLAARVAVALNDGPRAVDFAMLAPLAAFEEHAGNLAERARAA